MREPITTYDTMSISRVSTSADERVYAVYSLLLKGVVADIVFNSKEADGILRCYDRYAFSAQALKDIVEFMETAKF